MKIRYERTKNKCEKCGVENGKKIEGKKGKIILTVAHIDQNPTNNSLDNLLALCQRCHFALDKPFNLKKRWITKRKKSIPKYLLNL